MSAPDVTTATTERETGPLGSFELTRWSRVFRASGDSTGALNSLFETYQAPLLSFLVRSGYSMDDARYHLNGCFAALLRRDFLANVSPEKGRFRTFLIRALRNYLHDEHNKSKAGKRPPKDRGVSTEEVDDTGRPLVQLADPEMAPDEAFDREWGLSIMKGGLRRLNEAYQQRGKVALCQALEPILFQDATAPSYRDLGRRLGMSDQALRTAASRMRGELLQFMRAEIRETVDNPKDWEDECAVFIRAFEK